MSTATKVMATVAVVGGWLLVMAVLVYERPQRVDSPRSQHWWGSE